MKTKDLFSGWKEFLAEEKTPEKPEVKGLLREIDEEEFEIIQSVLDDMEGDVLAFNDLFDGKNRIIVPFASLDFSSDVGKFMRLMNNLESKLGWEADFPKGTVSRDKNLSSEELVNYVLSRDPKPVPKKTIKIGKFLLGLAKIADAIRNDLVNSGGGDQYDDLMKRSTKQFLITGGLTKTVLDKLFDLPDSTHILSTYKTAITRLQDAAKTWQQQAELIKKGGAKEDIYSIVYTRHPVDVLRMSDFDEIQSCHSPPSRGGASEYYKCAVAEAHGHGALAYVVENEDLEEEFGDISNLENSADFQEEEIFADDARGVGGIVPINRLRLRQIRYYPTKDEAADAARAPRSSGNPTIGGTEIAVPERTVYGVPKVPGFREAVIQWAEQNQEEAIAGLPKFGNSISGPEIVKFGGTYEDFGINYLLTALTGLSVAGTVKQNQSTEEELDSSLLNVGAARQFLEQYEEHGRDFDNFVITYEIEDGYIDPDIKVFFKWNLDEWSELPAPRSLSWLGDELAEYGEEYGFYEDAYIRREGQEIHLSFKVNPLKLQEVFNVEGAFWDPYEFGQLLQAMHQAERYAGIVDAADEIIGNILKREGFLEGSMFYQLAYKIETGSLESYEWELEVEGSEPEYDGVTATTTIYDNDAGKLDEEKLEKILKSRDFLIEFRQRLLAKPRSAAGEDYYIFVRVTPKDITSDSGNSTFDLKIEVSINEGDPDGIIKVFEALIEEMDDEDEIREVIQKTLSKVVSDNSDVISEQKLFRSWRNFLNG